jgi:hypothetical protein
LSASFSSSFKTGSFAVLTPQISTLYEDMMRFLRFDFLLKSMLHSGRFYTENFQQEMQNVMEVRQNL